MYFSRKLKSVRKQSKVNSRIIKIKPEIINSISQFNTAGKAQLKKKHSCAPPLRHNKKKQ